MQATLSPTRNSTASRGTPPRTIAVLDVGSSKVVCFIAQAEGAGNLRIRGIGHQLSKGLRSSVVTDFREAETSILASVHAAEQMAGKPSTR